MAAGDLTGRYPALALVRRELLTSLRSKRVLFILLTVLGVVTLLMSDQWPTPDTSIDYAGYASRQLLSMVAVYGLGMCIFFVPAFAANSIAIERERSTWDFLRMSMISPAGVVVAKLLNAIGIFFIILLAMAPLVSSVFFLIGVDFSVLLQVAPVIAMTIFTCASISLACSSVFRKSITTIAASYVGVILLMLGPGIVGYLLAAVMFAMGEVRSVSSIIERSMEYTSPAVAMILLLNESFPANERLKLILSSSSYQGIIAAFCLVVCWWNVRKPPKPPKISLEKPIDDKEVLRKRKTGFPFYILDPLKRKKPIEDSRNPMMVREIRWGLFNRSTLLVRVFYVSFVIYFIAGASASVMSRSTDLISAWFIMETVLTVIAAPGLIANSLTKEYELGNLDMLRMTLMQPKDMILGKLTAGFANMLPLVAASILSCIPVLAIMGSQTMEILVIGYMNLLICVVLSISIGLFASMCTQQTSMAILISYGLGFIAFFGLSLTAEYFDWYVWGRDSTAYSPILVLDYVFEGYRGEIGSDLLGWWLFASVLSLGLASALILASIYIFYTYKMRDR